MRYKINASMFVFFTLIFVAFSHAEATSSSTSVYTGYVENYAPENVTYPPLVATYTIIPKSNVSEENYAITGIVQNGTAPQEQTIAPLVTASGGFVGDATSSSSGIAESGNFSAEIYTSNHMLCSNQPSGQYCGNWESSCNQISSVKSGDRFYVYQRVNDVVHNQRWDYYQRVYLYDSGGNQLKWNNGQYYIQSNFKNSGNSPWLCVSQWFELRLGYAGKWRLKFVTHDNIDGTEHSKDVYVNMLCTQDSHCSKSDEMCKSNTCTTCSGNAISVRMDKRDFSCREDVTTYHFFENPTYAEITYDVTFNLYDPQGKVIGSITKANEKLPARTEVRWTLVNYPPSGGWPLDGTYTVEGKFVTKCRTEDIDYTRITFSAKACENCDFETTRSYVGQDNRCRDNIITHHEFRNTKTTNIPFKINFYLYRDGIQLDKVSNSGIMDAGGNYYWWVKWVPSGGTWQSGSYESKAEIVGSCPSSTKTRYTSAYPAIPSTCTSNPTTCRGTITPYVRDRYGNPLQGTNVYLDGSFTTTTDISGKALLSVTDSSCGKTHNVEIRCKSGVSCATKSAITDWDGDNDNLEFQCQVCAAAQNIILTATGNEVYRKGDSARITISTATSSSPVTGSDLTIYDPMAQKYVSSKTDSSGRYEYTTTASRTGLNYFRITASKPGYNSATIVKKITVYDNAGRVVVTAKDSGAALPKAKVFMDSTLQGETDNSGKLSTSASSGTHTVGVYCPSGSTCGTKNIFVSSSSTVSAVFDCACSRKATLKINVTGEQEVPVANAYVILDNSQEGKLSNPFGKVIINDVDFGNHKLSIFVNITKDYVSSEIMKYEKDITITAFKTEILVKLDNTNLFPVKSQQYNSTHIMVLETDENGKVRTTFLPVLIGYALYVGFIAWTAYDLCQCAVSSEGMDAVNKCTSIMNECLVGNKPLPYCMGKFIGGGEIWEKCGSEQVFFGVSFVPGFFIDKIIEKVGSKIAFYGVKGLEALPFGKTVINRVGKAYIIAKGEIDVAVEWIAKEAKYIFKGFRNVGKYIAKLGERHAPEITEKSKTFLKGLKPEDLPKNLFNAENDLKKIDALKGYLPERVTNKVYLNIIKEKAEKEGVKLRFLDFSAGKRYLSPDGTRELVEDVSRGTYEIYKVVNGKRVGSAIKEIDGLIIVDEKIVYLDVKHATVESLDDLISRAKEIEKIFGEKPSILLMAGKEDFALTKKLQKTVSELTKKGFDADFDIIKGIDFENIARQLVDKFKSGGP